MPPPDYEIYGYLNLGAGVIGEREKVMAELLRRADEKEKVLHQMIIQLNTSLTRAEGVVAKLTSLAPDQAREGGDGAAPSLVGGTGATGQQQQ